MAGDVLILTGAAGFLGSAIATLLSREYRLTAIDIREPSAALLAATPEVTWRRLDIAEQGAVASAFERVRREHGRVDVVIHFAAFYHFGANWREEYGRTNVLGTASVLKAAKRMRAERVIFASSIAAMEPPAAGRTLSECTPTGDFIPYARSKTQGEHMIAEGAGELPSIALRIAGAFTDWCELPPLYGLIKLWAGWGPVSRIVPGRGESGIPYIHRDDVAGIVRRCIERRRGLAPFEVFLASPGGAVSHNQLFPLIRKATRAHVSPTPIHLPPQLARPGVALRLGLGTLLGAAPYERPWMLKFVDRPWIVDAAQTYAKLGWSCTPSKGILDRLPVILERFSTHCRAWEERNRRRNSGRYEYSP